MDVELGYVLLAIIGIPILCVIGYGAIDALIINMHKKAQSRRIKREMDNYCRQRDRKKIESLNKANKLVPKYLASSLTSSLLDEINKIASGTGYHIHRVSFNSSFGDFIIDGGKNQTMYADDLSRLGKTSSLAKLGYKFPEGNSYIHAVALLTAIAQRLGSNYRIDIFYDSDDDISGVQILNKNLKFEQDLKSPI